MANKPLHLCYRRHDLLLEALRRCVSFHDGRIDTEVWSGLGTMSQYKPVVKAGYMEVVGTWNKGHLNWFRLTSEGVRLVRQLQEEGYTIENYEVVPPGRTTHTLVGD